MSYQDYLRKQSEETLTRPDVVRINVSTQEILEDEFTPAVPLSEQIRSMYNGGVPLHPLGEAVYDEDDVPLTQVDPANAFGIDQFEYQMAVEQAAVASHKKARELKARNDSGLGSDPPTPPAKQVNTEG